MAAIGPRIPLLRTALLPVFLAVTVTWPSAVRAGAHEEALRVIGHMTTALGDNDAEEAISTFDPSFPQYTALHNSLTNLVDSYLLTNEADVTDEQDAPATVTLTLDWSLTLRSQSTDQTVQRRKEVRVRLEKRKDAWKIVDFSPVTLFSPQM